MFPTRAVDTLLESSDDHAMQSFLNEFINRGMLFEWGDGWGIHWSGLSLTLSILLSFVFIHWLVSRQRFELTHKMVFDFLIFLTVGAFAGARLGYCFFVDTDIFFQFRESFPYWGVLTPGEGGFSSFGAIVGVLIASTAFAIKSGVSRTYLFDIASVTAPIILFFTRTSSFLTGELFGAVASRDWPVPVRVLNELLFWPSEQPQKMELLKPIFEKAQWDFNQFQEAYAQYGNNFQSQIEVNQVIGKTIKYLSDNPAVYLENIFPHLQDRYPVQLMEAAVQGILLFWIVFLAWSQPRRPGFISALFLILFSASEIFLDSWRFQNALEGGMILGYSEQVVLAAMGLLIGIIMMLVWNRSEILKTPGWGRLASVHLHRR